MRIALVQMDITWGNKSANYDHLRQLMQPAWEPGLLVILPEMFATGYDVVHAEVAEGSCGQLEETGTFLSQLAHEHQCFIQGSGISQATDHKRQNIVVVYNPLGQCICSYQKMHPFSYGGEHRYFEAGQHPGIYSIGDIQIGTAICYDLRFPELFRHLALQGARILTVPANWPASREMHWLCLLQARAIENQCYVVGVNRTGKDQKISYQGASAVFDPRGNQIALADAREQVLIVDLDLHQQETWRAKFPVLQDTRKELLGLSSD